MKNISETHTDKYGRKIKGVTGPFRIQDAVRDGTGDDGGILDRAIVGHLADGREVIIGELWAGGILYRDGTVSLDSYKHAEAVVKALNKLCMEEHDPTT